MRAARSSIWHQSNCKMSEQLTAAPRGGWQCEQTGSCWKSISFGVSLVSFMMQMESLSSSLRVNRVAELGPFPGQQNSLCFLGVVSPVL